MSRKQSSILAACLESIEKGERTAEACLAQHPEEQETLVSLMITVRMLEAGSGFVPRSGFREVSRARLIQDIIQKKQEPLKSGKRFGEGKGYTLSPRKLVFQTLSLIILTIALISSGTIIASASALPGDVLYPIKLTVENIQLWMSNDESDVQLMVTFLQNRVDEIQTLVDFGREGDIPLAVDSFTESIATTTETLDAIALEDTNTAVQLSLTLEQALTIHSETLTAILEQVPESARQAIESAIIQSDRGRDASQNLNRGNNPQEEYDAGNGNSQEGGQPEQNPNPGRARPTRERTREDEQNGSGHGRPEATPTE